MAPLLGLAVIVFILATKPVIITQTFTTPLALLIVVGIVAGVLLLKLVLTRLGTPKVAVSSVMGLVFVLLIYLLLWPFYADQVFPTPISQQAAPPPMVQGSTAAATGTFAGLDGHRGSGEASLIQVAGGSYVVRLAGVNIGSGPDLRLYLVPGADRQSPDDGAVELGKLGSSARGDLNFPVPVSADVAAGSPYTVLVWCRPFAVPVASATLG